MIEEDEMGGGFVDRLVFHTTPHAKIEPRGELAYEVTRDGVDLIKAPLPSPVEASTLRAVVDTIGDTTAKRIIHVRSPSVVTVYGDLLPDQQRPCYLTATFRSPLSDGFFGQYHDPESFVIALMSAFDHTEDLDIVLRIVGNLESEVVVTSVDDGITQKAAVRQGIARKEAVVVKTPVLLSPYRTFPEVKQPVAPYILRLKGGGEGKQPLCALFGADGDRWRLEAMASIKTWLAQEMPKATIIA